MVWGTKFITKKIGVILINLFLALATTCFFFSCTPKKGDSCQFNANVYGDRITHQTLPVNLFVNTEVPAEMYEIMKESVKEINRDREYIRLYQSDVAGGEKQRNFTNEVYFVTNWEEDRKQEQARTHAWWRGDSIEETDILINVRTYDWNNGSYNFKTLMTHEFLHALGMMHQESDSSGVMYPYLSQYQVRGMTEREYKNLECAYGK